MTTYPSHMVLLQFHSVIKTLQFLAKITLVHIQTCPNCSWGPGEGLGMWVCMGMGGSRSAWMGMDGWGIGMTWESCGGLWGGDRCMHSVMNTG